jgi:hypothetical protein
MAVAVSQVQQLLPCIGAIANRTLRTVSRGSLLQYKRGGASHYGIVESFRFAGNVHFYKLRKAQLYSDFIDEYQSELGPDAVFQVKRKSSAKLIADLDTQRCIAISVEEVEVRSTMVQAVGVVFDAGQYKKMTKHVPASPWVFWTHFEIDEENDLCCIGKNDTAIYSFSALRSDIHQQATLEVGDALAR